MGDQRLPFPTHGTRGGEGAPRGALGEAARLLYFTNLIASTAGVPVFAMKQYTQSGSVSASVHGPLAFKSVSYDPTEPAPPIESGGLPHKKPRYARLVWLPEGFVITPRTSAAPDGYGMPPTADGPLLPEPPPPPPLPEGAQPRPVRPPPPPRRAPGPGTPGGPLREVIINRFKGNQYPDVVARVADPSFKPREGARAIAAPLFHMEWEVVEGPFGIGVESRKDGFRPQFKAPLDPDYKEPEDDKWYCHRPMYHLGAEDKFEKTVFKWTNKYRKAVGRKDVTPALRGTEGSLSTTILFSMQEAHVLGHSSDFFMVGYKEVETRTLYRDASVFWAGENLATVPVTKTQRSYARLAAIRAMRSWRTSPPHYANMIDSYWDPVYQAGYRDTYGNKVVAYGCLDTAVRGPVTIKTEQFPPYELTSPTAPVKPPFRGAAASQLFSLRFSYVHPSLCSGPTDDWWQVGVGNEFSQGHAFMRLDHIDEQLEDGGGHPALQVTFKGRAILISEEGDAAFVVLAAKIVHSGERKRLRVITADRAPPGDWTAEVDSLPITLTVSEGDLMDFRKTKAHLSSFALPKVGDVLAGSTTPVGLRNLTGLLSTVKFSASGDKAVFCFVTQAPTLHVRSRMNNYLEDARNKQPIHVTLEEMQTTPKNGGSGPKDRLKGYYFWGDTLHFMEWTVAGGWQHVLSSDAEVTSTYETESGIPPAEMVAQGLPEGTGHIYGGSVECIAQYKMFADYAGEELVYAEVRVDSRFQYHNDDEPIGAGPTRRKTHVYTNRLRGSFVFPNGEELVFQHVDFERDLREVGDPTKNYASGMFLQFLHLDIMRPTRSVHVRHEFLQGGEQGRTPRMKSELISHNTTVKTIDNMATLGGATMQTYWWDSVENGQNNPAVSVAAQSSNNRLRTYEIGALSNGTTFFGFHPGTPFETFLPAHKSKAVLVGRRLGRTLFEGGTTFVAGDRYAHSHIGDFVGPEMAIRGLLVDKPKDDQDNNRERIQVAYYRGHHIAAGRVGDIFTAPKLTWQGDDRYFYSSSLDIRSITSLPDLKQNIMPIGVL